MGDFEVVQDPAIPAGTVYLVPSGSLGRGMFENGPLRWQEDPWPERHLPEPADTERRIGLTYLAGLLDGLCEDFGLDPDVVWRGPRLRLRLRSDRVRWVVEERLSLTVHPPWHAQAIVTAP
jgi:hypothetical protein